MSVVVKSRIACIAGRGIIVFCMILLIPPFLFQCNRQLDPAVAIRARAKTIADREGIIIGLGPPETFFVPPYTAADGRFLNSTATQVDINNVPLALDGIEKALLVYPPGFLSKSCKAIFLCGSLISDGAEAGGTWKKSWFILVANTKYGKDGVYGTALHGVHHEFSSLIWTRFPQMQDLWFSLLPLGWKPVGRNSEAVKAACKPTANPINGFLAPYGATTEENDFNMYAEIAFTNPAHVARQAERYPVVAKKLALLMEAYIKVDPRMEDVFKRLTLLRFRSYLPGQFREKLPGEETAAEIMQRIWAKELKKAAGKK